jgi:hypothetical protein
MSARAATGAGEQATFDGAWGREAARLLALLRQDRRGGVTVAAMRERGIEAPAQAIYTLQLAGYTIDRVPAAVNGRRSSAYRLRGGPYQNGSSDDEP